MRFGVSLVAGAALMAALVTGCGGSSDSSTDSGSESPAAASAVAFVEVVGKEDANKACGLLSQKFLKVFENQGTDFTCEKVLIKGLKLGPIRFPEAKRTKVSGTHAEVEVEVSGGETIVVELEEEDGDWKVSELLSRQ